MTIAAFIALTSAVLAVYVAALAWRFSFAPGWGDQRWFALAAVTVAAYAILDLSTTLSAPDPVVVLCSKFQMAVAGLHLYAWIRYSDLHVGAPRTRRRALLGAVPLVLGLLSLIPGLVFDGTVRGHTFAPLGLQYRDAVPTLFGTASWALQLVTMVGLAARYVLAWRRGVPHAQVHLLALLYLLAMVANDTLAAAGILPLPYLIDVGFLVPVAVVAYSVSVRFTQDARALAELRTHLERQVVERTAALAEAQAQLHRAEQLAGLGRLASGVAHEVNSPVAAVATNLRYVLGAQAADGAWPADARECLEDALASVERITAIARQMSDAGRLAFHRAVPEPLALREVALESARLAEARRGGRRPVVVEVDAGLRGLGERGALVQVLAHLLVNALQALPEGRAHGRVAVRGEGGGGRVRLVVEDDGVGMEPAVLRRAFEPFFTTREAGAGMGLGLAAARGLVLAMGGELRLESTVGRGTTATVELPAVPALDAAPILAPMS